MLTAGADRKEAAEDPPPVPEIPKAFASPSFSADGSNYSFSVNETESLRHVDPRVPTDREGLIISGVSYMDLSESDSESEAYQVSNLPVQSALHRGHKRHTAASGIGMRAATLSSRFDCYYAHDFEEVIL